MLWPSRRFVVAMLALGTAARVTRALAVKRPDPWRSSARYELVYRVRLRELVAAAQEAAKGRADAATRDLVYNYFIYPYAEAKGRPVAPPGVDVHFRRTAADETVRTDQKAR